MKDQIQFYEYDQSSYDQHQYKWNMPAGYSSFLFISSTGQLRKTMYALHLQVLLLSLILWFCMNGVPTAFM